MAAKQKCGLTTLVIRVRQYKEEILKKSRIIRLEEGVCDGGILACKVVNHLEQDYSEVSRCRERPWSTHSRVQGPQYLEACASFPRLYCRILA